MILVSEALNHIFTLANRLEAETVPLAHAAGRVLANDVSARVTQPPFSSSAMDGYAVINAQAKAGMTLKVVGESAAGDRFNGRVNGGEAVRIFTGAPVPEGADCILIQEDAIREGETITVRKNRDTKTYIRPAGGDFRKGDVISAPRKLSASDIALMASMNIAEVTVTRKPVVALIANGNELVMPGETPRPDQIVCSNNFGLKALLEEHGAEVRMLPIARDTVESLTHVMDLSSGADLVVTIGGASVGDHDLVHKVAVDRGMELDFYKVAMQPGKPLMAGSMNGTPLVGLPGNPVSSMVCGHIFLRPMLNAMLGFPSAPLPREIGLLARDVRQNGGREHYMRAKTELTVRGVEITPFERQDSSLLTILGQSDALLVRPPNGGPLRKGASVEFVRIS
ncbi:molybdopterin molybdenumtransferase MoeA [Rhodobacterales bacterium 52_120_T64]|nr:molybdopterin molybdenumtransferase MoeA [Rhodobacterales bacterium 52_120_T64]